MVKKAKKISIIGGSGTGKTTLANNLGKELKIPVYHIDGINYFENWKQRDKEERDKIILEKVQKQQWIIDGTYMSTLEKRLSKSDLIIYLDYSSLAQLMGVIKRYIKNPGKEKSEIKGCRENITWDFIICVLKWRKNKRQRILNVINQIDSNKIIIFKNRRQLNRWFYNQFNKKISST